MSNEVIFFGGFAIFILIMLALDLGVFNKEDKPVSLKSAGIMSVIWVSLAIGFYFPLKYEGHQLHNVQDFGKLTTVIKNHQHDVKIIPDNFDASLDLYNNNLALEFITGYVIEY